MTRFELTLNKFFLKLAYTIQYSFKLGGTSTVFS